jgi:spore coat polysaccharide biosynthesis protein SpsF
LKAIFISVRTGSTRLPNKSILKINDKYTIEYVINSVKKSKYADKIILCTTELEEDNILCDIAKDNNIDFYRGDELNKSKRWYGACKKYDIDFFVTADGDDLFYDVGLSDLCFEQIENDYIDGQGLYNDVYGMTTKALKMCLDSSNDKNIEPHDMIEFFKSISLKGKKLSDVPKIYEKRNIRMTLDYEDDFKFFSKIINEIKLDFNIKDVLYYIDRNPNVIDINYHREQDWQKNQGKIK